LKLDWLRRIDGHFHGSLLLANENDFDRESVSLQHLCSR
jgi:hypothetical protein